MKRKIIALLFLLMGCTFLNAAPYSEKIKELLVRLDSLIAQKNTFAMLKEAKIAQLHKLQKDVRTLEERYWLNKNLYDDRPVLWFLWSDGAGKLRCCNLEI